MRNVYVQLGSDGQIENVNLYAAFDGFSKKQYDVHFFTMLSPSKSRDDIVCGAGVGMMLQTFRHLGVALPQMLDYPDELNAYLGRRIWTSTLGEVRTNFFSEKPTPLFVKPQHHKLFNGKLMHSAACLTESTMHEPETKVWVAEPIGCVSEYRVFVLRGQIMGIKHYYGNYRVAPDYGVIDRAIADYASAPVAYSIDFAVTDQGATILMEVNDSFALGCYGLDCFYYAQMIEARWDQITGSTYRADYGLAE